MKWEHELEAIAELAEVAWESSMDELAAFGCIEHEQAVPWWRYRVGGEDELASRDVWAESAELAGLM